MENSLTVILGAGFSANAGMLTAKEISKKFDRDLKDKLLSHSSSEWYWIDDKDDTFIHNGQLSYDSTIYSYIFNELIKCYKEEKGSFDYYEYFYQYIIDMSSDINWLKSVYKKAKELFLKDYPLLLEPENRTNSESHLFGFENIQTRKISDILNYLIQDCLIIQKRDKELEKIYQDFIDYISIFENVDIFTLNHDLLLERILNLNGLKFSKGFNIENSPITHEGSPVPFFNNTFNEKIKIHKLHGSFDFFMMKHYENNGLLNQLTGQYDYFTTDDPMVKHFAYKETENNQQQQKINLDIVPKFITGTRKLDTINQDTLFKKLFQNFQEIISKTENLLISGYSFNDEHLNKKLKQREFHFINQNPTKEYPFNGRGRNIKLLADLKNLI